MESSGEFNPQAEPVSAEIAEACGEFVTAEDKVDMGELAVDQALGYAFTLLLEAGVEDPEEYLRQKGILE